MTSIPENLNEIKRLIIETEKKYHRPLNSVRLLAVSKGQSLQQIQQAIDAGQFTFAESYVQEALPKIAALKAKNIEWHFIGNIQSNKIKAIAENFDWVQSVAKFSVAEKLNKCRPDHLQPLNVCIEVNLDNDASKSGVKKTEILSLAQQILTLPKLRLRGLMSIPKPKLRYALQLLTFQEVTAAFSYLQNQGILLDTLSMGMTNDFIAAIAAGSSLVRIGTGIFGKRGE